MEYKTLKLVPGQKGGAVEKESIVICEKDFIAKAQMAKTSRKNRCITNLKSM
ncbi:MAG: hypothetical protein ACKVOQ_02660 [Cyclobacteriaceae bacterium]